MAKRRLLGVAILFIVMTCAGWLLRGWHRLLDAPDGRAKVVVTATLDAVVHIDRGDVEAEGGSLIRSNPITGRWWLTEGVPLAVLAAAAMVPAVQMMLWSGGRQSGRE